VSRLLTVGIDPTGTSGATIWSRSFWRKIGLQRNHEGIGSARPTTDYTNTSNCAIFALIVLTDEVGEGSM